MSTERQNKILQYMIDHIGNSPTVADIAAALAMDVAEVMSDIRYLQTNGKLVCDGQAFTVLCPPTINGVTHRVGLQHDFGAGRVWGNACGAVTIEVRQRYMHSVQELQDFIDVLIAAQCAIEVMGGCEE